MDLNMGFRERIAAGVDTVDNSGNTIVHWAASMHDSTENLEEILTLGASIDRINNAGRLPLHSFCTRGWFNDRWVMDKLQWIIEHTQNIDTGDVDGIRPLHIAAMLSEHFVKALLAAGADPSGKTAEGLTPLHLASRAQQSNIVGLLCQQLEQTYGADGMIAHINTVDKIGRSALHYACKSGRPETVSVLLTVGADPWIEDHNGHLPMDACCEFEMEQDLWRDSWRPLESEYKQFGLRNIPRGWDHDVCGGLKIEDELRPWVRAGRISSSYSGAERRILLRANPGEFYSGMHSNKASTRLEEILDMLFAAYPASEDISRMQTIISRCLEVCTTKALTYSHRCFERLKEKSEPNAGNSQGWSTEERERRDDEIQSISKLYTSSEYIDQDDIDFRTVHHLLALREYDTVEFLLCRGTCSPRAVGMIVRLLAEHGFGRLLGRILSSEHPPPANVYKGNFNEDEGGWDPVLLVACQRGLPNMEVVRLLVEQAGVDVNARGRTAEQRDCLIENFDGEPFKHPMPLNKFIEANTYITSVVRFSGRARAGLKYGSSRSCRRSLLVE